MTAPVPSSASSSASALFEQHKTAVLGAAAAAVVGLALLQKKKGGTAGATSAPAGTIPAAGVVSSGSVQSAYPNTTATDVYNSLQPTLEAILNQQGNSTGTGSGATLSGPAPIASSLFAPTGSGQYAQYANGTVAEIESDGSQLGLSYGQWEPLRQAGAAPTITLAGSSSGQFYTSAGNLAAKTMPATT